MSTPEDPKHVQHLAAEVGRLFGLYHEQVDRLLTERTQENEWLRAELGRLDALQAEITRIKQDNDRLRAERDELLAAFRRMADLIEEVRRSRGGGVAG
jgi:Tfp pilus assembly protein PilN